MANIRSYLCAAFNKIANLQENNHKNLHFKTHFTQIWMLRTHHGQCAHFLLKVLTNLSEKIPKMTKTLDFADSGLYLMAVGKHPILLPIL